MPKLDVLNPLLLEMHRSFEPELFILLDHPIGVALSRLAGKAAPFRSGIHLVAGVLFILLAHSATREERRLALAG